MNTTSPISNTKFIENQNQWNLVATELQKENKKILSYDEVLLQQTNWQGKKVLDYGSGPGVLGETLQKFGACIKSFDVSKDMREQAGQKIGLSNVYESILEIPHAEFDVIICNLVLCIVSEQEVEKILSNIRMFLKPGGHTFVGFCNPKIFNIAETQLDFRFFSGQAYTENHHYKKIKKEGLYKITENHRPVEWYTKKFYETGLILLDIILTPEYQIRGQKINDFIIFKLGK